MRTASCLTLLAIGAILTFAVTGHPSFLNLQVAGLVIMMTGVAGLFLPRRANGWLRRRTVLQKGTRGPVVGQIEETRYPSYVVLNPRATRPRTFLELTADDPTAEPGSRPADSEVMEEYLNSDGAVERPLQR
jgi:hypothetical protein